MQIIERRAFVRHQVRTNGRVVLADERVYIACEISNRSEDGAQVLLSVPVALPQRVLLWEQSSGLVFECDMRWRRERVVGLQIIDIYGRRARRALLENGFIPSTDDKVQLPCVIAATSSVSAQSTYR